MSAWESVTPAAIVAVPLTAAELRFLAGVHNSFAERHSLCDQHSLAADCWDRAALLHQLADKLGPPASAADGLLWIDV